MMTDTSVALLEPEMDLPEFPAEELPARAPVSDRANILLVDDRTDKLLALEAILVDLGQNLVKVPSGAAAPGRASRSGGCCPAIFRVRTASIGRSTCRSFLWPTSTAGT